ncbi:MAG: hypothetical protein AAFV88_21890 [Planctomycetota bacterium]
MFKNFITAVVALACLTGTASSQGTPYDNPPELPPSSASAGSYFRVRYEASTKDGELDLPVSYTVWIPPNVATLRGIVVHQHGCGEGSCRSGLTGAFDLHWQRLAAEHDCALLAAVYEQPQRAECRRWSDPRAGSNLAFLNALEDLGRQSRHSELVIVPWALWGHSGGAYWCGAMTLLYPDRVAAVWMRSGIPPVLPSSRSADGFVAIEIPPAAFSVPMMVNTGTEEGVSIKEGRFASLWPRTKSFHAEIRKSGGLIGVAVDPLTGHACGNQRYLSIPWFDACLKARLPSGQGEPLLSMTPDSTWLADLTDDPSAAKVHSKDKYPGDESSSTWLPDEATARAWVAYVKDTNVPDQSPPPRPSNIRVLNGHLTWTASADLQSGICHFVIHQDGKEIATVPEKAQNRFGRPLFQDLQYSDTPQQPLQQMRFQLPEGAPAQSSRYKVIAVNTVGIPSEK